MKLEEREQYIQFAIDHLVGDNHCPQHRKFAAKCFEAGLNLHGCSAHLQSVLSEASALAKRQGREFKVVVYLNSTGGWMAEYSPSSRSANKEAGWPARYTGGAEPKLHVCSYDPV